MIQRSLNITPTQDENEWLRESVFHTKCRSHAKICDLIIDNGSYSNVVATKMVEKLNLKTEEHPHPYKIQWLRKGHEVQVNKRCLVDFSIGKNYRDEIWCDIALTDVSHLLLSRPWLYDIRVIYDSYKNI